MNENQNLSQLRKQAHLSDSIHYLSNGAPFDINDENDCLIKDLMQSSEIHIQDSLSSTIQK